MQRTPTRTRSQGPVDFPLDQDIDKLGKLNNPRKKTPLEDVPQSTPNRQDPIDPLHVPSSRSSSRSSLPAKTERGRSRRRRNPDLTQNGDSDSEEDPPYEQAPEDPQGLISTLIKALNARPTSDHTTSKFKTPGMKARIDSTAKVFKTSPFSSSLVLYASSYLGGRAAQWFEPYLELLDSKKPDCILNNWDKFEQQLFTLFGDPNEVRNAEYELNNLQMKESSKAWNDAAFTFHFRKGLPPRITDQLAISGLRLTSLQQLIDRTIELDNCYHDKNRSKKPENSSKQDDSSKSNGNKSSRKPQQQSSASSSTPASSFSKSKTRTTPKEISSVLGNEGFLKDDERARREKEGLSILLGFPKAKWIFKFSTFPSFEWELVVLDAPGMDDTILGHDFLVHWNPDVNWKEGVINLRTNTHQSTNLSSVKIELNSITDRIIELDDTFPPGDFEYPDSSPSIVSSKIME
ncbi:hypothetical protein H4Q26_014372 [Puccinia striiformis f. sp. tritici PST-130]|nr:hypothetical protein H4Q26_014372 [Puccinia striiformis f. sp. tritici PST-130]